MDKSKKKRIKRYIAWACLAALVVLLTVMPLVAKNDAAAEGPQASILSATAEIGSITTTLRGGGNLEDQDAQDVIIPTGVKITEFLVKNGDTVTEGTPVATVDKVSVMEAITSVNDTMKYLQEELEKGRDEKVAETLTAVPGGRVKKIFAQEGETVQEVMLRDGALAGLSIDSMMAVEIETESTLTTGESVEVTLADKTVVTGRVESNLDGKVVVTVDDEGYEVGQKVTVKDLGTGILYIHNAWKATAISGTISKVNAKEEQTLKANASLFTLTDRDFTGQLQHRANQHREYEELLQTLLIMQESGTINAPCDGIVSGIEEDSVHLLSGEGEWEIELLTESGTPTYRVVFLDNEEYTCTCGQYPHTADCVLSCTESDSCTANAHKKTCIKRCNPVGPCDAEVHKTGCITMCKETANPKDCPNANGGYHKANCIHKCINAGKGETCLGGTNHYLSCIESCNYNPITKTCPATGDHKDTCIRSCVHADYEGVCKPGVTDAPHYDDCIESCIVSTNSNQECPASKHKDSCYFHGMTYTAYVGIVDQVGSTQIKIYKDAKTVYNVRRSGSGWEIVSPGLDKDLMITEDWVTVSNPKLYHKNDIVLLVTGYKNGKAEWSSVEIYQRSLIGDTDLEDLIDGLGGLNGFDLPGMDLSSMMGGFSGFGNFGGLTTQESESLHDLQGSTLLTVTPQKTMELTITLDERDIAKVRPGMSAEVKVEALRGQEFQAEVTDVAISGTNNGGSSKFTATLQLNVAGDMLPGMSASAILELETREDILILPVAAVYELEEKTVVYTSLDEKSKEPTSPVEVVTGVSDGEKVEIRSGLNRGDTVYYSYYDTLEEDASAQANRFTFG